jgi:hypothetical protein
MYDELKEVEKNQLQLLRALCSLNGLRVDDIVERSHIPHENVEAFLTGATAALSDEGFRTLFSMVGVDDDFKLDPNKVHFWEMKMSRFKNYQNLLPLTNARSILGEHQALCLQKGGNVQTVLIRSEHVRVVLNVRIPPFYNLNVADLGLTPGPFEGSSKISQLPAYYQKLLAEKAIRPNYFDLILDGTYVNEDLELVRLSALEHDITLSELVTYITRHDTRNQVQKEESTESVEKEHSAIVTTLPVMEEKRESVLILSDRASFSNRKVAGSY